MKIRKNKAPKLPEISEIVNVIDRTKSLLSSDRISQSTKDLISELNQTLESCRSKPKKNGKRGNISVGKVMRESPKIVKALQKILDKKDDEEDVGPIDGLWEEKWTVTFPPPYSKEDKEACELTEVDDEALMRGVLCGDVLKFDKFKDFWETKHATIF